MLTRDNRPLSTAVRFVEVIIYILALNKVLSGGLHDPGKIIAYAGGYATGNFVGSLIENKMAVGYLCMQMFPEMHPMEMSSSVLG